jgi:hypothetical protein
VNAQKEKLAGICGKFVGRGINHEGQPFTGIFEANRVSTNGGLSLSFQAVGDDGTIFHAEKSLMGPGVHGKLGLWVLSTNHPGIFERQLTTEDTLAGGFVWVYGFGKRDDRSTFREEIRIECAFGKSLKYVYSWGMPGGDFAERSGVTMNALAAED